MFIDHLASLCPFRSHGLWHSERVAWVPFMTPEDGELSFEETLSALLGLVGRRVSVRVADAGGKPTAVALFAGVLERTTDISILDRADAEAQFFHVGSDLEPNTGFLLHAGTFAGGQAQGDFAVRFLEGHVLVTVAADEGRDEPARDMNA